MIMYQLAQKLGFDKELVKNYKMVKGKGGMEEPETESILREINKCVWTIGYTGQSPERLKAHMRNMNVFDVKTLRAKGGIDKETGYKLDGDYFGLPWPCYGTPELKHPGSPNLYDTSKHVMDGGGNFRANFGVERDGVSLLAPAYQGRRRLPAQEAEVEAVRGAAQGRGQVRVWIDEAAAGRTWLQARLQDDGRAGAYALHFAGHGEVDPGGAGLLRDPHDRVLHVARRGHHEVGELVDDREDVREGTPSR